MITLTMEVLSDKVEKVLLNEKLAWDENAAHFEHAVKEIVDVRVPQEMEEVVGIVSFIPKERWRLAPWSKPRTHSCTETGGTRWSDPSSAPSRARATAHDDSKAGSSSSRCAEAR